MARAKRTQRAEARRRYRASTLPVEPLAEGEDEATEEAAPAPSPRRGLFGFGAAPAQRAAASARPAGPARPASGRSATSARSVPATPRPGLFGALRQAAGPANIPADVRALPSIALHSKALVIPLAVTAVAGILLAIPSMRANAIVATIVQIAIQPPPMIIGFLAGMLAPRGAWLVGGITTTIASTVYALIYAGALDASVTPLGWTRAITTGEKFGLGANLVLTSLVFGVGVGAFAGFYRRFLAMSSPQRPPARATSARQAPRRR